MCWNIGSVVELVVNRKTTCVWAKTSAGAPGRSGAAYAKYIFSDLKERIDRCVGLSLNDNSHSFAIDAAPFNKEGECQLA